MVQGALESACRTCPPHVKSQPAPAVASSVGRPRDANFIVDGSKRQQPLPRTPASLLMFTITYGPSTDAFPSVTSSGVSTTQLILPRTRWGYTRFGGAHEPTGVRRDNLRAQAETVSKLRLNFPEKPRKALLLPPGLERGMKPQPMRQRTLIKGGWVPSSLHSPISTHTIAS